MNKKYNTQNTTELDSVSTSNFATTADNVVIPVNVINSVGYTNAAPTFSIGDGKVTTAIGTGSDIGRSVLVQADGKILVGGYSLIGSKYDFALARYNSNGSLDTSFNGNGKNTNNFTTADNDFAQSVALQADNKVLMAGYSYNGSNYDFAVARYFSDGTFEGSLTTTIGSDDRGQAVIVQTDGKMVVAGYSDGDFAVVRYNNDGSVDTSFDTDGKVTTAIGFATDEGYAAVMQSDGKLVVAGRSFVGGANGYDFALVRYNTDGSLDNTFAGTGKSTVNVGGGDDWGRSVVIESDGSLLVAGDSNGDFAIARYNADGSFAGSVTTAVGAYDDHAQSVTVQTDGKMVVAGISHNGVDYDIALVRYNHDGSLDSSFSGDGKLTTAISVPDNNDRGYSVTIQNDGRIVVAGTHLNGSNEDFAVVRYNSDGSLDLSFDSVNTLNGNPTYIEGGTAVVLDSTVNVYDPELATQGNYNGASVTLARNGGANAQDAYYVTGNLTASGSDLLVSGVTVATFTSTGGALVITFNADATQARVDELLSSLAYANSSATPPTSVQIDWTFSDGNTGGQGTGGALTALGSTTINITPVGNMPMTDFNHDGKSDLLWTNTDGSVYAMTLNGLNMGPSGLIYDAAATENGAWQVINTKGDYNGDGNTDLLLWNSNTSSAYITQMDGASISAQGPIDYAQNITGWTVADSTADYNNDSKSDILWWNSASSTIYLALENSTTAISAVVLFDGIAGWTIQSAGGDYNGDSKDDILLWNQGTGSAYMLTMDGTSITGQGFIAENLPSDWSIVDAKGDYNGDGKSDILWRNNATGMLWQDQMNGTTIINGAGSGESIGIVSTDWTIIDGSADFNGDGKSDLLAKNTVDGRAQIWLMNGATASTGVEYGPYTDWTAQHAHNDVNGDGKADLLWKNINGATAIFQMDGTTVVDSAVFGPYAGWSTTNAAPAPVDAATVSATDTSIEEVGIIGSSPVTDFSFI